MKRLRINGMGNAECGMRNIGRRFPRFFVFILLVSAVGLAAKEKAPQTAHSPLQGRISKLETASSTFDFRPSTFDSTASRPKWNILLFTIDSCNVSRMSLYGNPVKTTPNLDDWAKQAIVFDRAYSVSAWTAPGLVSILSGVLPGVHRVDSRDRHAPEKLPTLLKIFLEQGYQVPNLNFFTFAPYYQNLGLVAIDRSYFTQNDGDELLNYLDRNADRSFFIWYHTTKVHQPYNPPDDALKKIIEMESVISHRSSVIGHRSSVIGHQSSVIGHQSSVIGHRSSVVGQQVAGRKSQVENRTATPPSGGARGENVSRRAQGTSGQVGKSASQQVGRSEGQQIGKSTSQQVSKSKIDSHQSSVIGHQGKPKPINWEEAFNAPGIQAVRHGAIVPKGSVKFRSEDLPALLALYDSEIYKMDRFFGQVLEKLRQKGLADQTLLVVTADHGEEMLEHGFVGHASTSLNAKLYEELVHIPLVIRVPGQQNGARVSSLVQQIDIAPTILDLMHLPVPEIMQGRSLKQQVIDQQVSGRQVSGRRSQVASRGGSIRQWAGGSGQSAGGGRQEAVGSGQCAL